MERYLAHPAHRSTDPASLPEVPFCLNLWPGYLLSAFTSLKKREDSNFLVESFLNTGDIYMYFFFPFLVPSFPFPSFPFPVLWLLHTGPFPFPFPAQPRHHQFNPKRLTPTPKTSTPNLSSPLPIDTRTPSFFFLSFSSSSPPSYSSRHAFLVCHLLLLVVCQIFPPSIVAILHSLLWSIFVSEKVLLLSPSYILIPSIPINAIGRFHKIKKKNSPSIIDR